MLPDDWTRLIQAIRSLGLTILRIDRNEGTILVKIPFYRN